MIKHYTEIPVEPVEMEGASGATIRWLISESEGAPNFYMRLFELVPGGHSPRHRHDYEHEIFVLEGEGTAFYEGEEHEIGPGYFLFIPPNAEHQLRNTGSGILKFLCLIPKR
jgi:quercetin dioxygenase-like cupin family protein